ncbi:MAG: MMPL family transporter [Deltaproteobacteria bacterium]|nr:MMPL family transporter [Deltaproteobacteria bacterium]
MENIRYRIEKSFESLSHFIFRHKWLVVFSMLVLIGILAAQIPHIIVDTSTEAFFFDDDPEMVKYEQFREQFGRDEIVVVAIKAPEIFSIPFLQKLRVIHGELEKNVPHLNDITSLVNVTAVRGEKDELIIEELMESWPDDTQSLKEYIDFIKAYAMPHQLYRNYILSEDGKFTAIILESDVYFDPSDKATSNDTDADFESIDEKDEKDEEETDIGEDSDRKLNDEEKSAFVAKILDITKKYNNEDFQIYVAGGPVLSFSINQRMQKDVPRFTAIAVITIFFLLFLLFRRISGVLLPFIVVILSMISTLSLFALFGRPFTVITQIIPSFIISVGVCGSVHLLAVFYRRFLSGGSKDDAMAYAMGHSGLAIVMTSMTTAAGLLSFAGAKIAPIADLGIFAASGVMLSLLYTLLLLHALIAILPIRRKEKKGSYSVVFFDRMLIGAGDFATRRPWFVLAMTFLILSVAGYGIVQLRFSHNPVAWFPEDDPFPKSVEVIDKGMKGSMVLEAVVETKQKNALYQPDIMNRLEAFNRAAENITESNIFIGKTISVADTLKQIHKSLNANDDEFYRIPQDSELIAQEFILFENGGTDDLENLIDSQYSKARITMKLPWEDANTYTGIQKKIISQLEKTFQGIGEVTITGMIALLTRTIYNVIVTMMTSYIIAGVVITVMMILLLGNVKYGLISMIPNLLPVIIAMGLMGYAGMNLDLSNILIGSIIIGLAVDDTVHFFHNYRRYYMNTGNVKFAVQETLLTTGRALLFTSLVLASGFFLFVASDMINLINFGAIAGLAIITALLADIILAPALMVIFSPPDKPLDESVSE